MNRRITDDEHAVSELVGEILLIGIVVLAFGIISVTVHSYMTTTPDAPHIEVTGRYDPDKDQICLKHQGGEPIDKGDLRILVDVNGNVSTFDDADLDLDRWTLGSTLTLDTEDITQDDTVRVTIVHIPSSRVIASGEVPKYNASTNIAPRADAGGDQINTTGVPVLFNGSESDDPDGIIVSWHWDFGDGNASSGETSNNTYSVTGVYTVTLTVTDDDGATDSNTCNVTIRGMVGYWRFDEGSGSTANDSSGNENHGEVHGVAWTTGVSNSTLSFNGTSDYVNISNSDKLNPTGAITLEAWVKWGIDPSTGDSRANIISKNGDDQYQIYHNNNNRQFEFAIKTSNRKSIASTTEPQQDVWYHVVGTYNDSCSLLCIYVNATLEDSKSHSGSIVNSTSPVNIGRRSIDNDRYFTGVIDEVVIYNRALSADEVRERYNETKPS